MDASAVLSQLVVGQGLRHVGLEDAGSALQVRTGDLAQVVDTSAVLSQLVVGRGLRHVGFEDVGSALQVRSGDFGLVELGLAVLDLAVVICLLLLQGHNHLVDHADDILEADLLAVEGKLKVHTLSSAKCKSQTEVKLKSN